MSLNLTDNEDKKTILWVLKSLEVPGGGERLLLEGARHYRSLGHRVIIVAWHFSELALFNNEYEYIDIICLDAKTTKRHNIVLSAFYRIQKITALRKIIKEHDVDLMFSQGEYDVAVLYLASLGLHTPYRFLIFGQTYQYPHDNAKYSFLFKKHLKEIVNSCPGYKETTPLIKPKLGLINNLANELICLIRLFAVRGAEKCFSFSKQIQWETQLLFDVKPELAAGAYRNTQIRDYSNEKSIVTEKYGLKDREFILSLSGLGEKKRIDLIIESYSKLNTSFPLIIGGSGEDLNRLNDLVQSLNLEAKVRFIGRVDDKDVLPLKAMAKIFVSMDIGDFDISPLEALAVGTRVICPVEFEVDEYLSSREDLYIIEPKINDLTAKMDILLTDTVPNKSARLEGYSWEDYFNKLLL
ncbi:MAG: glycosyltransferase [Emcibacteraceae bacterium]|nr:glycosyltransferase [Emcibacteraceae bacterium]MDG1857910.1 glycosyltransferase [Emcibacteraceae bacterium]